MTALSITLGIIGYLLIGYCWAMLYIHELTDGYWESKGIFTERVYRSPMGAGTAISMSLFWPVAVVAVVLILVISTLFSADFWKKVYRL